MTVQFDEFQSKLPTFHQFFDGQQLDLSGRRRWRVTKVIHEFGHGLTCKHFGGECHEMGVMFLVLTPCLYCNVSDSWMLPNKWHRAVDRRGRHVYRDRDRLDLHVRVVVQRAGLLNQLCLSTMFVCSVSTVMFNANPLLRYDGYYILSDLVEIPNLRPEGQRRFSAASWAPGAWGWKSRTIRSCRSATSFSSPLFRGRRHLSLGDSVRHLLVLVPVFEPYGLKVVSQMLAMVSIISLVVHAAVEIGKVLLHSWKARQSETQEPLHHAVARGGRAGVPHFLPAAVPRPVHARNQTA